MRTGLSHPWQTPAAAARTLPDWFNVFHPRVQAQWRLLCLPHAGGSANFFRPWSRTLPSRCELVVAQYPGREERLAEECQVAMDSLADALTQALARQPWLLDRPYVLLGHSMGAAVAYELCLRLQRRQMRLPLLLVLSACEGPGCGRDTCLHQAGDRALLEEIVRLNPRLEPLLHSPEVAELVLPALRSDYRLIETYRQAPPSFAPLEVPVQAWVGREDGELSEADACAWSRVAPRGFELQSFPGGHFYLAEQFGVLGERLETLVDTRLSRVAPLHLP